MFKCHTQRRPPKSRDETLTLSAMAIASHYVQSLSVAACRNFLVCSSEMISAGVTLSTKPTFLALNIRVFTTSLEFCLTTVHEPEQ
jgi:hypothetical protein